MEGYDSTIHYDIVNPIVTVFGKEAIINYDMQCSSCGGADISSDNADDADDADDNDDNSAVKVDRKVVVKQTRKWELSNGKWLQTI